MDKQPTPSPIKVHPPLLSDKTGSELLEFIQQKTGAPGAIVVLLTKRMDNNTPADFQFTTTFTVGIVKKYLPSALRQIADHMQAHMPKDIL